jgi:uncharacterized membrane protein YfhO
MRKAMQALSEKDSSIYRVEKSFQYTENDPMLYGYNGLTHYSSSTETKTMEFLGRKLYLSKIERVGIATIYKNTFTLAMDSLFGIKYFFKDETYDNGAERGVDAFINIYALPISFMADKDLLSADINGLSYFGLQNKIFQSLSGIDTPIFTTTDIAIQQQDLIETKLPNDSAQYVAKTWQEGYLHVTAPLDDDKLYYFDFIWNKDLRVKLNDKEFVFRYDDLTGEVPEPPMLLTDKYSLESEASRVEVQVPQTITLKPAPFWQESKEALGEHYAALADEPCDLRKISSSHLTCAVEAKEDGNLFFTIPNDDGWTVKVDGRKVKTETAFDLFMTIPLTAGVHEIEMKYTPKGLPTGIIITTITLFICAIYTTKKFWSATNLLIAATLCYNAKHG